MPSLRAKLAHSLFKFLWSSEKPLTKERLLKGRKKTPRAGWFVRRNHPVQIVSREINGIKVDFITPKNQKTKKIIIYLHGGGFVYGISAFHNEIANSLAVKAGAKVLLVDYSLAPEYPFPVQINEIEKVYKWLLNEGYDSNDIFFAGDSAGGHLAITSTLVLKSKKCPLPQGIIAMSAGTDLTFDYPSFTGNAASDFILSPQKMHFFRDAYIAKGSPTNPLISPTFANLKGFPRTQLFVADNELIFDDVDMFYKKLKKAGVSAELHIAKSLAHAYPLASWLVPEAEESVRQMAKFINED